MSLAIVHERLADVWGHRHFTTTIVFYIYSRYMLSYVQRVWGAVVKNASVLLPKLWAGELHIMQEQCRPCIIEDSQ